MVDLIIVENKQKMKKYLCCYFTIFKSTLKKSKIKNVNNQGFLFL